MMHQRRASSPSRTGPKMVDVQWNRSSPTGPALHEEGGSLEKSCSSLLIRLVADITQTRALRRASRGRGSRL